MIRTMNRSHGSGKRRAFTLVESMAAITITTVTASVLLLSLETSLSDTNDSLDRLTAEGMAQQLLDEIMLKRYKGQYESALAATLGPSNWEAAQGNRAAFDDTDDFVGWSATPPQASGGETIGNDGFWNPVRAPSFRVPTDFYKGWRQRVDVYYVNETTLQKVTSGQTNFRCVEVNIERLNSQNVYQVLATKRRVYGYVLPST